MAVNYGQVAIVPKGEWNVETQYKVNNLVSYDGSNGVQGVQTRLKRKDRFESK